MSGPTTQSPIILDATKPGGRIVRNTLALFGLTEKFPGADEAVMPSHAYLPGAALVVSIPTSAGKSCVKGLSEMNWYRN